MKARQKKRIKDTADLVRNVREMHKNFNTLHTEYDLDLKEFFFCLAEAQGHKNHDEKSQHSSFSSGQTVSEQLIPLSIDTEDANNGHDSTKNAGKSRKAPPKSKGRPPKRKIKEIYRSVMKKCHPDKMKMEDLSEKEYYTRRLALKVCTDAYPIQDMKNLLFAAALVEVYVQGVSEKEYIDSLNSIYNSYTEKIAKLQSSIEWAWGSNWDTLENRYKIIESVCAAKGIALPSKIDVLDLLIKHEIG